MKNSLLLYNKPPKHMFPFLWSYTIVYCILYTHTYTCTYIPSKTKFLFFKCQHILCDDLSLTIPIIRIRFFLYWGCVCLWFMKRLCLYRKTQKMCMDVFFFNRCVFYELWCGIKHQWQCFSKRERWHVYYNASTIRKAAQPAHLWIPYRAYKYVCMCDTMCV
jgi:hypothetical protein